MLVLEYVVFFK